jgi:hypothetical protein
MSSALEVVCPRIIAVHVDRIWGTSCLGRYCVDTLNDFDLSLLGEARSAREQTAADLAELTKLDQLLSAERKSANVLLIARLLHQGRPIPISATYSICAFLIGDSKVSTLHAIVRQPPTMCVTSDFIEALPGVVTCTPNDIVREAAREQELLAFVSRCLARAKSKCDGVQGVTDNLIARRGIISAVFVAHRGTQFRRPFCAAENAIGGA